MYLLGALQLMKATVFLREAKLFKLIRILIETSDL